MVVAIGRLIYIIHHNVLCYWIALNEDAYLRFQRTYVDVSIENAIGATCEQALKFTFRNTVKVAAAAIAKHREGHCKG
jgi:hypothetical protein